MQRPLACTALIRATNQTKAIQLLAIYQESIPEIHPTYHTIFQLKTLRGEDGKVY